jgi:hypothetical protein
VGRLNAISQTAASLVRCTPLLTTTMRLIVIFLAATFLTSSTFGQTQQESNLLKAYKSNSNKKLQKFIETWIKETSVKIDSNEIRSNDTLNNLYEILNSFYNPIYPKTKCILMQANLQYTIVDNLDKDTLMKRIIFKTSKKNPDSVYKAALLKPGYYDYLIDDYGDDGFTYLKNGSIKISIQNLKFKSKKILLLTEKYISILSNYLLDNSIEQINERAKRLSFIKDEIEFWQGNYGYIRVENAPASISITMDSLYQNAIIGCRGGTSGNKTTLRKVDNKWTIIESHRTSIE